MRILLIEDDDDVRSVLERGLQTEGYGVDACSDGDTGLDLALEGGYAAIVLDLLLPSRNGYSVCAQIRSSGIQTPVLVLTAKSGEFDQVDLLDAGADDFLSKPVSMVVLLARIRALIRRTGSNPLNVFERTGFLYNFSTRQCFVSDAPVVLSNREDQLLRVLLVANGTCVSRQEVFDQVWGPNAGVDSTNLDIYLRRLRAKLAPIEVENVRGIGYRIATRS